jgi:hypothetical protein
MNDEPGVLDKERGDDPDVVVGTDPELPEWRDPDPGWQPDPSLPRKWREIASSIGKEHRPKREDVYPYLLIRAVVGDRGARPTWPPAPSWESPDILLIDASYGGPFDPSRLVTSPVAGRSYRVFVRIWNLGLLPAVGVHVKAWAVNPGFFGAFNQHDPYYEQNLIGGRWVELSDRTRPDCVAVVELDRTWDIDPDISGHHCMLAEVDCPLDPGGDLLLANADRHVGQRNLNILTGSAMPMMLMGTLGGLVPEGFTLEVTHAGKAALPVLLALTGGRLEGRGEVFVPGADDVRVGVPFGDERHLLTAFTLRGRSVTVPTERLVDYGVERFLGQPGGVRRLLDKLGPEQWGRLGGTTKGSLEKGLPGAVAQLVDGNGEMEAAELAKRLGGPAGALHALRFTLTDPAGGLVGGYTVVVG